jgi:hypothetical protein
VWRIITIVVILASNGAMASQTCKPAEPEEANAGVCMLSVGGRTLVANERCRISISRDGHLYMMDTGKYQARVEVNPRDGKGYMQWNGGALGAVKYDDIVTDNSPMCYRNNRSAMCISDFARCD